MPVAFSKDTQKRVSYLDCPVSCMVGSVNKCCSNLMNGFFSPTSKNFCKQKEKLSCLLPH